LYACFIGQLISGQSSRHGFSPASGNASSFAAAAAAAAAAAGV